jgi:hypothetical protein
MFTSCFVTRIRITVYVTRYSHTVGHISRSDRNVNMYDRFFEVMAKSIYLGMVIKHRNYFHIDINASLHPENASQHLVLNHLSSGPLSSDGKIKIHIGNSNFICNYVI